MVAKKAAAVVVDEFGMPALDKSAFEGGFNLVVTPEGVYSLNKMAVKPEQIDGAIKSWYKAELKKEKARMFSDNIEAMSREWERQTVHIQSRFNRGQFIIPDTMRNKPVMVHRGVVCELRPVIYKPNCVVWEADYMLGEFKPRATSVVAKKLVAELEEVKKKIGNVDIEVHFEQDVIVVGVNVVYEPKSKLIYTPGYNMFHSMGESRLCTGNYSGDVFWNDANFVRNFNTINVHSLGYGSAYDAAGRTSYNWMSLLNCATSYKIVGRGTGWRA